MFVLTEMKDTVQIVPSLFDVDTNEAVIDALNKKLANKVCDEIRTVVTITLIQYVHSWESCDILYVYSDRKGNKFDHYFSNTQ